MQHPNHSLSIPRSKLSALKHTATLFASLFGVSLLCTACPLDDELAAPGCGDGVLDADEECDDTNLDDGDGCSATCELEAGYTCSGVEGECDVIVAICGDGIVTAYEECDDGDRNGAGYNQCNFDCTVGPFCGDGVIDADIEECDDGAQNGDAYNGCGFDCQIGPYCGDGVVYAGIEECDDGNGVAGDGCSASCRVESGR